MSNVFKKNNVFSLLSCSTCFYTSYLLLEKLMQNGKLFLIFYNLDRWNFQKQLYQKLYSKIKIFITLDLTTHLLSCPLVLIAI